MATGPLLHRKAVRDAIRTLLKANFNDVMEPTAEAYAVDPVVLDFDDGSVNFAVSHIAPENIEICQFQWGPGVSVAACLYTGEAVDEVSTFLYRFSGKLFGHLDFYVRDREGAEGTNTEDRCDAIEDAALQVMNNPANNWTANSGNVSVIYSRKSEEDREYLIPLADGFATRIPIKMLFEVKAP